jgi:hypothetical protein
VEAEARDDEDLPLLALDAVNRDEVLAKWKQKLATMTTRGFVFSGRPRYGAR